MPRELNFLQIEELYNELLANSFELASESMYLLSVGGVGRAHALAVLSLEEAGKAIMIHEAKVRSFERRLPNPVLSPAFWKDWGSHRAKLRHVRDFIVKEQYWFDTQPPPVNDLLLGEIDEYAEHLDVWAKAGDSNKLRGLYVDVDHGTGAVVAPRTNHDSSAVVELLELAHQIGWQLRLGDHIEFIAAVRHEAVPDEMAHYAAYADGGPLAGTLSEGRGWEAHNAQLLLLMAELDEADRDEGNLHEHPRAE